MFTKTQESINAATGAYLVAMESLRDQLKAELATVELQIDVCRKFADVGTCEPQPAAPSAEEQAKAKAAQEGRVDPAAKLRALAAGTVARAPDGRPLARNAAELMAPAASSADDLEQRLAEALGAEPKAHAPAGL